MHGTGWLAASFCKKATPHQVEVMLKAWCCLYMTQGSLCHFRSGLPVAGEWVRGDSGTQGRTQTQAQGAAHRSQQDDGVWQVRTRAVTLAAYISAGAGIRAEALRLLRMELPLELRLMGIRMSSFFQVRQGGRYSCPPSSKCRKVIVVRACSSSSRCSRVAVCGLFVPACRSKRSALRADYDGCFAVVTSFHGNLYCLF